jgi:malonate decarboxylase beta subunit
VWQLIGGEQRVATGFADSLVEDDPQAVRAAVQRAFVLGKPAAHRSEQVETYLARLGKMDPANVTPETMRSVFDAGTAPESPKEAV